jgi:hypothetical protein
MTVDQDPNGYKNYMANSAVASCGFVNVETGEFKEGRQNKDGNLTYHNPLPWWKRLFGKKDVVELWGEWEYLTTGKGKQTLLQGGLFSSTEYREWDTEIHVYSQSHRYTGERRYRAKTTSGLVLDIDAKAYEKTGRVVAI